MALGGLQLSFSATTSAVLSAADFLLALAGFLLLTVWRTPPWIVVGLLAVAGVFSGFLQA